MLVCCFHRFLHFSTKLSRVCRPTHICCRAVAAGPATAGPMLRRIYKKWSSWWNGAVITDIYGLKLNEICHHQMRFMGSSTSKVRLRPGLRPGPRWGSLQRSPRPPSWWGGGSLSPPQDLIPSSRLASNFGPSGLKTNSWLRLWLVGMTP